MKTRRFILALGGAMLAGGWGATLYAEQQVQIGTGGIWISGYDSTTYIPPGRIVCASGVVSMAIGAGLIAFGLPKTRTDTG